MAKYTIYNDDDPNDTFEVEANDVNEAALVALSTLGWNVGSEPDDDEENEDAVITD